MQIYVAEVTKKLYLVCAGRNCVLNYTHHSLLIVKVLFINILDINMIRNLKFKQQYRTTKSKLHIKCKFKA